MADIKISGLAEATSVETADLLVISQSQGGGGYTSKKVQAANLDMVKGLRYYGLSATDPTSPTPADGDEYYNTVLDKKMYYDAARSKWLSFETIIINFSRNGLTPSGSYYRIEGELSYSGTNGFYTPWNGTITGLGYTRDDFDAATFEITEDGVATAATFLSGAVKGKKTDFNVDFDELKVLGVRNQAAGNTTENVFGYVFLKWRI